MTEEKKDLPNCSEQFRSYVDKSCRVIDDVCDTKTLPKDEIFAMTEVLKLIPTSKKDQEQATKILEDYIKDDRECKI